MKQPCKTCSGTRIIDRDEWINTGPSQEAQLRAVLAPCPDCAVCELCDFIIMESDEAPVRIDDKPLHDDCWRDHARENALCPHCGNSLPYGNRRFDACTDCARGG
jgi:hypothetical protein